MVRGGGEVGKWAWTASRAAARLADSTASVMMVWWRRVLGVRVRVERWERRVGEVAEAIEVSEVRREEVVRKGATVLSQGVKIVAGGSVGRGFLVCGCDFPKWELGSDSRELELEE